MECRQEVGTQPGDDAQRLADQVDALERDLAHHWHLLRRMCADQPDYPALLGFLVWLYDWWEAVGPDDHAWLLGQLRRHIPDWHEAPGTSSGDA